MTKLNSACVQISKSEKVKPSTTIYSSDVAGYKAGQEVPNSAPRRVTNKNYFLTEGKKLFVIFILIYKFSSLLLVVFRKSSVNS